ncbi:MAG: hypothetical protein Q7Q73_15585, partial [Verrucomicrobiota bacterium JB024]|nr:hypothetical protein [Verrucomicrobiota bacterium JB024]
CAFERNAYHIKFGDRLSGSFQIGPRNLFLSFGGTKTLADIWIVPNAEGRVNSGQGSLITENKFGNENYDPNQSRILVAAEDMDSGEDRLSRKPSEDIVTGKPCVYGIKLLNNLFSGGGHPQRGLVYSRVRDTTIFFGHNQFVGSTYPYLIEFDSRLERLSPQFLSHQAYVYEQENFSGRLSNFPGYAVVPDPRGRFSGQQEALPMGPQADDPSYKPLVSVTGKAMTAYGKAEISPARDSHGNMTAVSVTLENIHGGLRVPFPNDKSLNEGRLAFIDTELKAAPKQSMSSIWLMIIKGFNDKTREEHPYIEETVFMQKVVLQPYWQRITIPLTLRDTQEANLRLVISPSWWFEQDVIAGKQDAFDCGNVRVYHAKAPVGLNREGVRLMEDEDLEVCPGIDPSQIICSTALTADRTIKFTVSDNNIQPLPGTRFRVSRVAGGEGSLNVADLISLSEGEWCEVVYTEDSYVISSAGIL